jgi:hypothetical protein
MSSPRRSGCWAGLIICKDGNDRYIRAGVFLGPKFDDKLSGWEKRTFEIY